MPILEVEFLFVLTNLQQDELATWSSQRLRVGERLLSEIRSIKWNKDRAERGLRRRYGRPLDTGVFCPPCGLLHREFLPAIAPEVNTTQSLWYVNFLTPGNAQAGATTYARVPGAARG
jgi:hypothetical protein